MMRKGFYEEMLKQNKTPAVKVKVGNKLVFHLACLQPTIKILTVAQCLGVVITKRQYQSYRKCVTRAEKFVRIYPG